MKKIDVIVAFLAGEGVAWLVFWFLRAYGIEVRFLSWILAILFPILTLVGLWICYIIGKKFLFVLQTAKFFLTGVLASLVYLGILNLLFWVSGIVKGWGFSVFVIISFLISTFAKYWGNKFWTFERPEMAGLGKEFSQFFVVTLISLGINVLIASLLVNVIGPQFNTPPKIWANIGAIVASIFAAAWNFLGYKFIVFKR